MTVQDVIGSFRDPAVIAAGAVATRDITPLTITGGVPAKVDKGNRSKGGKI